MARIAFFCQVEISHKIVYLLAPVPLSFHFKIVFSSGKHRVPRECMCPSLGSTDHINNSGVVGPQALPHLEPCCKTFSLSFGCTEIKTRRVGGYRGLFKYRQPLWHVAPGLSGHRAHLAVISINTTYCTIFGESILFSNVNRLCAFVYL